MVEREKVEILEKHPNPVYIDSTSNPNHKFIPNINWLARMKANYIANVTRERRVMIEELVATMEDTWLNCSIYKSHVVENPLECSSCF